jgi:CRP/FNR family transcriptional regulator, anaerobic regulatory protein
MQSQQQLWQQYFPQFIATHEATMNSLMASANLLHIPAGKQVFYSGCSCENYLLMLEGRIKTQLISESGREVLLYHVCSGDSCVLTTSCLLGGNCYPAEGITETEVLAFSISASAFHRCLEQSAFFREFVFKNFAHRLAAVISRMEEVVFGAVDARLSKLLVSYQRTTLNITHHELAAELGTAREVVSRHLKYFEKQGWLQLNRGTIEITDFNALKKISF